MDIRIPNAPTDHAAVMNYIEYLLEKHGGKVSLSYLGATLRRRAIPMITLGGEDSRDTYLYVGAHHAMEWITSSLLLYFADDFLTGGAECGARIVLIPMLNCDGVELQIHGARHDDVLYDRLVRMNGSDDFSRWQANARGVDLNHNYDAGFYEYKKIERSLGILGGAPTRYSGPYPESEPETGALANYIRFNDNIKGILTLHTQGEEIYTGSSPEMRKTGAVLADLAGYTLSEPEDEAAKYGGLTDRATSLGIPSFTVECGRGKNPLPPSDLLPIYEKIRPLLFTFPTL